MDLTRFYEFKQIDVAAIRAVRDVLKSSLNWAVTAASYALYYPGEYFSVDSIDAVDKLVKEQGKQPSDVYFWIKSQSGRLVTVDSRRVDGAVMAGMTIRVDNLSDPPHRVLDAIEPVLGLVRLTDVPTTRSVESAFVAHSFSDEGMAYANELARFMGLLGIKCQSGRGFAARGVSDKVMTRLARHDVLVAILTGQEDATWLTQEMATANALGKAIFILKHENATLKEGILGDQEYISFPDKQLSKAFIPILEGLGELHGKESGYF